MCTFIGIESLAANALIELFDQQRIREVSFDTLVKYGMTVIQIYQRNTGVEAVLLLSEQYQNGLIENYSNYFDVEMDGAGHGVLKLNSSVNSTEELRDVFRWPMDCNLISAFLAPEALEKLGVPA